MSQPRPTAPEMIEAVRTFLIDEVLPTLDGRLRFHTRVAANALEAIERELTDGPAAGERERRRLIALLSGHDTDDHETSDLDDLDLEALGRELASRIRTGAVDIGDPALIDHLTLTARDDVAIANPKWLAADS